MDKEKLQLKAPVFNVQGFSIHDGPGIRTTVFVKGCPLRCLWCQNPESNSPCPELMSYKSKCTGCGRCLAVCPQQAICMELVDGKMVARTNRDACVHCGVCVSVCPGKAREIAGEEMTVEQVLERVAADKLFYDTSGGGVTVSGGEAVMYPQFVSAFLEACQEAGIHTAVESCSFASEAVIDKIYAHVDLALLDIKHMDSAEHKRLTGVPNEQILDRIRHIHNDLHVPTVIRIPVVPGCNDSEENIRRTARFAAEVLGKDVSMHLLPYHSLGESKNESLGNVGTFHTEAPSKEKMEQLKAIAGEYVSDVLIGGSM
ncbi:MAG: glycyl-radical enzyme activating protein [Lachnospiraceae bacterium]|nr:glycyl-radical enzyme activating protein [Lachnospiraceae bacterium]